MASCAECVHVEVCKDYINAVLGDVDESQMCGDDCEFHKERSRFVELPCNPGDALYLVDELFYGYKIIKIIVDSIIITVHRKIGVRAVDKISGVTYGFIDQKGFGSIVFFTREEAERALKERKNSV